MFFGSLKSDVIRRHAANSRFNKQKYRSVSGLNGRGITVVQAFGHETGYCDGVGPAMGTTTHALGTVRHHRGLSNVYYSVRDKLRRSDRSTEKDDEDEVTTSAPVKTGNSGRTRSLAANSGVEIDGSSGSGDDSPMVPRPTRPAGGVVRHEQAPTLDPYSDLFHESGQWLSNASIGLEQVAEDINREYSAPTRVKSPFPAHTVQKPFSASRERRAWPKGKPRKPPAREQSVFSLFKSLTKAVSSEKRRPTAAPSYVSEHYIDTILETSLPMRAPRPDPSPVSPSSHYRAKVRKMCDEKGINTAWMTEHDDLDWAYNGHLFEASQPYAASGPAIVEPSPYRPPPMVPRQEDDYFLPSRTSSGNLVSEMETSSASTPDPLPHSSIYTLYADTPPRKTSGYYRK